jgi:uncharacterized RDD family membrane protein YckC
MSHAGPPADPPPDPNDGGTGGDASGQQPYNPYPDNWGGDPGGAPGQPGPYAQPNPHQQPNPYQQPSAYEQVNPYGQPSPYAAPGAPGSPANPYAGAARADRPTFGFGGYASWLTRVGAYVIDALLGAVAALPLWVGYAQLFADSTTTTDPDGTEHVHFHATGTATAFIWIGIVTALAFQIWNVYIRQGRTGATYGKSVMAVRLVNSDLQPIGPGLAFVRNILHIVDAIPCYLGYLWPIWDSRKQTFADKIMRTFVIHATAPQPPVYPPQAYPPQS